jgi:hypothetical protein
MYLAEKANTRGNPAMTLGCCFFNPNFNGRYGMLGNKVQ